MQFHADYRQTQWRRKAGAADDDDSSSSSSALIHLMKTETFFMDNVDYPRIGG
jgi:hypothetical protein